MTVLFYDSRLGDVEDRKELNETELHDTWRLKDKGNRTERYTTQGPVKRTWE